MGNKIKVLLVDDEDRFCETTSKLLTKKGFDTAIANKAEKALDLLKTSSWDVIVLDLKMSGMDGHRALNEIKETNPETQVIILTGHGSRYSATRALVRDAFDYLAKPCDIDLLASRIEEAYRAKHHGFRTDLKKALDIMTPINEVMTLSADSQVRHAMEKWFDPTQDAAITASKKERAPDVIVVLDEKAVITGVLTKIDIIRAVRPEYIAASDVPTEESARFSSIFWNGFFSDRVTTIAGKKIREIMSERPPVISENANLLEVAHLMWKDAKRLLLVQDISRIIGIIRDQDIFEEILAAMTHKSDARG